MKALAINEFTSGQWDKPNPADPTGPPLGIAILEFRGFPTEYWWCWAAVGFIIGTGILNLALFVLAMSVLGPGKKRVVMSEEALEEHALASRLGTMSMSDLPPVGLNRKRDLGAEETIPEEAEEGVDLENGTSPKAAPAGLAPLNVPRSSVSPTPAGPESSGSSAGTPQTASEVATPAESTKRSIPGRIGHHLAPGAIVGHVANMGRLPFPPFSPNGRCVASAFCLQLCI